MKFLSFIVSSLLCLFISQYSITGLPINDTSTEGACPAQFVMVNGICMPMESMTTAVPIETSFNTSEQMISIEDQTTMASVTWKISNACPEGTKRDESGVCQKIEFSEEMKVNVTSTTPSTTTDLYENTSDTPMNKDCPEGMKHDKHGICQKMQSSEEVNVSVESTTTDLYENTSDAPVNNECPEGMEHDEDGVCQVVEPSEDAKTTAKSSTTSTELYETTSDAPMDKECPKGMKHDEDGVCQEIKPSKNTKPTAKSATKTTTTTDAPVNNECPEGMEHDEDGVCQEIEPSEDVKTTFKSTTTTTDRYENTDDCPKGMKRNDRGRCEKIQSSERMKIAPKSKTEDDEYTDDADVKKGCPEGTEADEQGACQEIKPSRSGKTKTDPKAFLKEDGSCPDNYKMIDGRCLYIKSKTNSTSYSGGLTIEENDFPRFQPKSRTDESSKVELVPVLPDNSCPEGTVYSEYGLCQKHARPAKSSPRMKSDGSCPDDFELIDGKCTYQNIKSQSSSTEGTTTVKMIPASKNRTPKVDTNNDEEFSNPEVGHDASNESTTTPFTIRMSTTPVNDVVSEEEFSTVAINDDEHHS